LTKENDLSSCVGSQNDTVTDCPIFDNKNDNKNEFIVLAHNTQSQPYKQFIRVKLPSAKFRAQLWSRSESRFVDVDSDIMEQKQLSNTRAESTDFEMFVPCDL
jgi:hypothetical protein